MKGFATKAIHGTVARRDPHGTLRVPVYDSVAFEFDTAEEVQQAFEGRRLAHSYSRISNPTIDDFEQRVRLLADAAGVIAVASGMAAISNVILALAEAGTNIVTTRSLFGNTYSLFEHTFRPWGLEVRCVDLNDAAQLRHAIDERTRAVYFETITNPQLEVADARAISALAHEHGVPVVVDGTVTTPYLFPSKQFGVDVEVISSTKYISGGATSVGGVIIDNGLFSWKRSPKLKEAARKFGPNALLVSLRREVYRNLGACISPHNAYLQTLGLETLSLRIDKSCANALALAKWLQQHPAVAKVNYPGLENAPDHQVARGQFARGFGGILTFALASKDACFRFMDGLQLVRRATNINDNKTLVLHPASTIFCEYSAAQKATMGVPETLLRLSVGIEDVEDIVADLDAALARTETAPSLVAAGGAE
jgi:O-acetylhomoserine (thiol)-lyase